MAIVEKSVEKRGNRIMTLDIFRGDSLKLRMAISPEIENWFKGQSGGNQSSSGSWHSENGDTISFWSYSQTRGDFSNFTARFYFNYGGYLMKDGRANMAIFRTVGLSNGISFLFPDIVSEDALKELARQYKDFIIQLVKMFLRPIRIKVEISEDVIV